MPQAVPGTSSTISPCTLHLLFTFFLTSAVFSKINMSGYVPSLPRAYIGNVMPTRTCPCSCTAPTRAESMLHTNQGEPWTLIITGRSRHPQQLPGVQNASSDAQEPTPAPPPKPDSDLPPSYDAATASVNPEEAQSLIPAPQRVAALPRDQPVPGTPFLSILDRTLPPVIFTKCPHCGTGRPSPSRLTRYLTSTLRNHYTITRQIPLVYRRASYYDEATNSVVFRYTTGLDAGELERTTLAGPDWTRDYSFGLAVQHRDPGGTWVAEARIFFMGLAACMQRGIPWRDENKTMRHARGQAPTFYNGAAPGGESKYCIPWYYSQNVESPEWCAEVTLYHERLEPLFAAHRSDAWDYFSPDMPRVTLYSLPGSAPSVPVPAKLTFTAHRAEMDHRTRYGTYKKVLWYHRGVGYGNDLLNHPVGSWDEGTMQAYAEFARPLLPSHREPEA